MFRRLARLHRRLATPEESVAGAQSGRWSAQPYQAAVAPLGSYAPALARRPLRSEIRQVPYFMVIWDWQSGGCWPPRFIPPNPHTTLDVAAKAAQLRNPDSTASCEPHVIAGDTTVAVFSSCGLVGYSSRPGRPVRKRPGSDVNANRKIAQLWRPNGAGS